MLKLYIKQNKAVWKKRRKEGMAFKRPRVQFSSSPPEFERVFDHVENPFSFNFSVRLHTYAAGLSRKNIFLCITGEVLFQKYFLQQGGTEQKAVTEKGGASSHKGSALFAVFTKSPEALHVPVTSAACFRVPSSRDRRLPCFRYRIAWSCGDQGRRASSRDCP